MFELRRESRLLVIAGRNQKAGEFTLSGLFFVFGFLLFSVNPNAGLLRTKADIFSLSPSEGEREERPRIVTLYVST